MNKKAQAGPIALIFLVILFMIMWFLFLGDFIATVGAAAVVDNSLTGVEAFLFHNINLIIFLFVLVSLIAWGYFSQ